MKRAFAFIESLDSTFFQIAGRPTIKVLSDQIEVYFDVSIIRSFKFFDRGDYDTIRLFPNDVSFPYERVMQTFRTILPNKELVFNFTII